MSIPTNQKGADKTHPIAAIILFVALALGSVQLKINGVIGETALASLLSVSGVFSFIIFFQHRIKKAGPTGIELHKAVQEVRDAEDRIRELAQKVADLIETANVGSIVTEDYDDTKFRDALIKIRNI